MVTGTERHGLTGEPPGGETAGQDREEKEKRPHYSSLLTTLSTLSEQTNVQLRPSGVPIVESDSVG